MKYKTLSKLINYITIGSLLTLASPVKPSSRNANSLSSAPNNTINFDIDKDNYKETLRLVSSGEDCSTFVLEDMVNNKKLEAKVQCIADADIYRIGNFYAIKLYANLDLADMDEKEARRIVEKQAKRLIWTGTEFYKISKFKE